MGAYFKEKSCIKRIAIQEKSGKNGEVLPFCFIMPPNEVFSCIAGDFNCAGLNLVIIIPCLEFVLPLPTRPPTSFGTF